MGHKKVCFNCRKAFSLYKNNGEVINLVCAECGKACRVLNQKFKPPRRNDIQKWEVVKFLVDNGFVFQNVYKEVTTEVYQQIPYPENMADAREFVTASKKWAIRSKSL